MPLKTEDLSTFENYKKAIKQDAAKINAQGSTKFWVYRDVELPVAGGQKQKVPALIVLIDDKAVKPLLKGKTLICQGVSGLQDGKITLDPEKGKVPYNLLKTTVPLFFGKTLHIPSNADPEAAVDGEAPSDRIATVRPASSGGAAAGVLKAPASSSSSPGGTAGQTYTQLTATWNRLLQKAKQGVAADPARRGPLTEMMAGIPELLRGGKLAEAQKRLTELEVVLERAGGAVTGQGTAAPYTGIVKYRRSLLQFAQAKSAVKGQIAALKNSIASQMPDEADFATELAEELENLNEELSGVIDEAMQGAENEASPATDAVKSKIRKYLTELASNSLVHKADSNPLGVSVAIGKTLGDALRQIKAAMPA